MITYNFTSTCSAGLLRLAGQEYDYCRGLFTRATMQPRRFVSFKPALVPLSTSFFLLWLAAVSLPESGRFPALFRLALLPLLLSLAFDVATNKSYSLGSPLRDVLFPYWACLISFKILDMAAVSLWDQSPAPKWIMPQVLEAEVTTEGRQVDLSNSSRSDGLIMTEAPRQLDRALDTKQPQCLWGPVPHPPLLSFDRLLYGLDVVLLNRPGTPWLFPWRLRSLDWSLPALNGRRREKLSFGQPEWPLLLALIQQVVHILAHYCIRIMDLNGKREGAQTLWQASLLQQIFITFALGSVVAFGSSLEEAITFPLLIKLKILPSTALLGHSRRAILSNGLSELWGYRWHHNWRRSFVRTARLLPAGLTSSGNALWSFFLSGVLHSIMFTRTYPSPTFSHPCSFVPIVWEPGVMFFFVSQGVGAMVEKTLFPKSHPPATLILRRLWMYVVLIGTGRHLVNSMVVKGWLSAYEWNQLNYGNVLADVLGWKVFL